MAAPAQPTGPTEDESLPPPGLRTFLSLVLFIQLFLVFAAVLGNLPQRSELMARIVSIPGISEYLTTLHLDTAFQFPLADERDSQVLLALDVPKPPADAKPNPDADEGTEDNPAVREVRPDKTADLQTVPLVPGKIWPGIRQQRYLALGRILSDRSETSDHATTLAAALADGLRREKGIKPPANKNDRHFFVCRQIMPQPIADFAEIPPADRDNPLAPRWLVNTYVRLIVPGDDAWTVTTPVAAFESTSARKQPVHIGPGSKLNPAGKPQKPKPDAPKSDAPKTDAKPPEEKP
ncbi:MAG: hypothetical protein K8T25_18450 [Planctomycetia bacterium]|nr:hypothetical protein [Planctomycetia bacterium]